jgi:hypothetical protein
VGAELISKQSGTLNITAADPAGTYNYLTFTFDNAILLEAGKAYSFVLSFDSAQSSQRILLGYHSGAYNANVARAWYTPSGTWTAASQTFDFFIQGEAIPEASTLALLPSGALLLVFAVRRRSKAAIEQV